MANFFQRLFGRKQIDTSLGQANTSQMLYGWNDGMLLTGKPDPIFAILEECGIHDGRTDYKSQMKISRLAFDSIPFVKRAIQDMAAMVGNVEVKAVNPGEVSEDVLQDLGDVLEDLNILSEMDWITPHEQGANNLAYRISETLLRDGMFFSQDRFGGVRGRNYLGNLVFDPDSFSLIREDNGPYRFRYGASQDVERNPFFHMAGFDFDNSSVWGQPLLSGGGFFMNILVAQLVAIKNINIRKGAPINMNMLVLKDNTVLQNEDTKTAFINFATSTESKTKQAINLQQQGKPSDMFVKVPTNADLISRAFGVESLQEVDSDNLMVILMGFANLLGVPPELMGVVLGGSGFSPERFKTLNQIWGHKVDNLLDKVRPVMNRIIRNHLLFSGVDAGLIDRVYGDFVPAMLIDESDRADLEKTKAETEKIYLENASVLSEVDTNAAQEYLRSRGIIE